MSETAFDQAMMGQALALGRRGLGSVWPNPAVGCVIAKNGRVLGRGRTAQGGRPHAETQALDMAGDAARGATAYVTLEPCSHHGKTPPCCDALIAAGIARVVVAAGDPHEKVNGEGIARLRAAGVSVDLGLMQDEARRDNAGFLSVVEKGRPFVTLKLASTLDGRIATASGESRWITGPQSRRMVHVMRSTHDGVMIGAGTARADDPDLTVRGLGVRHQPVRIVVSRRLDIPRDGKLVQSADQVPVWALHGEKANTDDWAETAVKLIPVAGPGNANLDPETMLRALAENGMTRIFCEGGGALASALLSAGVVDRLHVFHAGIAIGAEGVPSIGAMGVEALSTAPRFEMKDMRKVGDDLLSTWEPGQS